MADTQVRPSFPRKPTLVRFQHNRCQNSPAALRNGEHRACSGEPGHLREARSLFGSGIKKSSDSITQLGETVPRLEGDDSWNTCRGSAWSGGGTRPRRRNHGYGFKQEGYERERARSGTSLEPVSSPICPSPALKPEGRDQTEQDAELPAALKRSGRAKGSDAAAPSLMDEPGTRNRVQ